MGINANHTLAPSRPVEKKAELDAKRTEASEGNTCTTLLRRIMNPTADRKFPEQKDSVYVAKCRFDLARIRMSLRVSTNARQVESLELHTLYG